MARNRMDVVVSDGELERVPRPFGRLGEFERLLGERFEVERREQLPSGTRVMFAARPRE